MGGIQRRVGSFGYGALTPARNLLLALLLAGSPAQAEEITIAALGDSLTQGYGLVPEDGFVPRLEVWLRDGGAEVRIINAGVSGDTTAGGLARIDWTLTPDVDALIVALGGNDVLRGLSPDAARENLDGILRTATSRGLPVLLVGITVPGNFGPEYKAQFEAIYPDLAAQHGTLLYPDFLDAISGDTGRALAEWMQGDGIHPNAEGVRRIVGAIGPTVRQLIDKAGAHQGQDR